MSKLLAVDAKIMAKGQITLPKDIRSIMQLDKGDRVVFVYDGTQITVMNAMQYALKPFQDEMKTEAKKSHLTSDEAILDLVMQKRYRDTK